MTFTTVMTLITVVFCTTTVTVPGSNPGHAGPVYVGEDGTGFGGSNGLPHAHRARGTPVLSTRTAVPACSTDWCCVARPFLNPWFVTRVSFCNSTGASAVM